MKNNSSLSSSSSILIGMFFFKSSTSGLFETIEYTLLIILGCGSYSQSFFISLASAIPKYLGISVEFVDNASIQSFTKRFLFYS